MGEKEEDIKYSKWICFKSDWDAVNLELTNVSITVIEILRQTCHYNFNWLHMFLFVISVGNHEVVLPLDSDGKNKVFKNVWNKFEKKNLLLRFVKDESMGSFSFYKEYLRELQHFFFFFTLQNAARIVRALFEIALRKRWPAMTYRLLNLSKVIDKRLWGWVSPLRQFSVLPPSVLSKLEEKNLTVDKMKDMRKDEIGEKTAMLICLSY